MQVSEAGYDLPASVLKEVFRYVSAMDEAYEPDGSKVETVGPLVANFEVSTVVIGFNAERVKELKEYHDETYWPKVQGGTPVAWWHSGATWSCDMYLYLMPDGHFEWTEP